MIEVDPKIKKAVASLRRLRDYKEDCEREVKFPRNPDDFRIAKHLVVQDPDSLVPVRIVYKDDVYGDEVPIEEYVHVVGIGRRLRDTSTDRLFYLKERPVKNPRFFFRGG